MNEYEVELRWMGTTQRRYVGLDKKGAAAVFHAAWDQEDCWPVLTVAGRVYNLAGALRHLRIKTAESGETP